MTARHILIPFHDFARGGTERVALTLAREWLDAGREVTILCGSRSGGTLEQADPRIRIVELCPPLPRSPLSRLKLGSRMAARLPELRPDLVFVPGNFHFAVAAAFRLAMPLLPLVAKVSNPLLPALPGLFAAIARRGLSAYVRPIDALVYMAPELEAQGRSDLPGMRSAVIAEPNLPQGYQPLPRGNPGDVPLILMIARLEPQKNLPLALEAFAALRRRRPVRLLILGEGAERPRLESLAAQLGVADSVEFPGYSTDVPNHLAAASALLLTSRFEGYPAVVIEALAADVPVVSTDCTPVLRGLLPTSIHGRIIAQATPASLADALESVLDQTFTSAGVRPATVAHHDAVASARGYLALFDDLVARRLSRSAPGNG